MRTDRELLDDALAAMNTLHVQAQWLTPICEELRARLAEPEPEPVAYRHMMDDGWEYFDAPTGEDCEGCQKLYLHPPRPTGLDKLLERIRFLERQIAERTNPWTG